MLQEQGRPAGAQKENSQLGEEKKILQKVKTSQKIILNCLADSVGGRLLHLWEMREGVQVATEPEDAHQAGSRAVDEDQVSALSADVVGQGQVFTAQSEETRGSAGDVQQS